MYYIVLGTNVPKWAKVQIYLLITSFIPTKINRYTRPDKYFIHRTGKWRLKHTVVTTSGTKYQKYSFLMGGIDI